MNKVIKKIVAFTTALSIIGAGSTYTKTFSPDKSYVITASAATKNETCVTPNCDGYLQYQTLWVVNDTYKFTKKKKRYADSNCKIFNGEYVNKGEYVQFYAYQKHGRSIIGYSVGKGFIAVNTKGILNVAAYVYYNNTTIHIKNAPYDYGCRKKIDKYYAPIRITRTYDDYGYSPDFDGWIFLGEVSGTPV